VPRTVSWPARRPDANGGPIGGYRGCDTIIFDISHATDPAVRARIQNVSLLEDRPAALYERVMAKYPCRVFFFSLARYAVPAPFSAPAPAGSHRGSINV